MQDKQTLDIDAISPRKAELVNLVESSRALQVTDLGDKAQVALVTRKRIELKNTRITVEKQAKDMREEAKDFQKKVIALEKELIGIIQPEEDRLKKIEADAEAHELRESRKKALPARVQRIAGIGLTQEDGTPAVIDQDYILTLDDTLFETFYNQQVAHHNDVTAARNRAKETKLREEEERIEREKARAAEASAAAERELKWPERLKRCNAIEDGNDYQVTGAAALKSMSDERFEEYVKTRAEQHERRKREMADAEERGRKAAERKAAEERENQAQRERQEAEKMERSKKFQAFLAGLGQTGENKDEFTTKVLSDGSIDVYRRVGTFKP